MGGSWSVDTHALLEPDWARSPAPAAPNRPGTQSRTLLATALLCGEACAIRRGKARRHERRKFSEASCFNLRSQLRKKWVEPCTQSTRAGPEERVHRTHSRSPKVVGTVPSCLGHVRSGVRLHVSQKRVPLTPH